MKPVVRGWLESRGLHVKEEFPSHKGICDLMGCEIRAEAAKTRLSQGQREPIGPLRRVHLWQHIPNRSAHRTASLHELIGIFRGVLDAEEVERELRTLEEKAFIRRTRAGTYQKINGWHPLHAQLVAVELKLHDWREACLQAQRYLSYAAESYIALPQTAASTAYDMLSGNGFRSAGVGLLSVSKKSGVEVVFESEGCHKATRAEMALQTYAVERFWRDRVKGKTA